MDEFYNFYDSAGSVLDSQHYIHPWPCIRNRLGQTVGVWLLNFFRISLDNTIQLCIKVHCPAKNRSKSRIYSQKPLLIWCYLKKHLHLIFEKSILKNGVGRTWFLVYFKLEFFRLKFKLDQKSSSFNFISLKSIFQKSTGG